MRDLDGPTHDTRAAARDDAVRERMNDRGATSFEKALAAFVGAAEGFAEEARKANLPALAKQAVDVTGDTVDEVRSAFREQRAPSELPDPALASAATLADEGDTLASRDYLGRVVTAAEDRETRLAGERRFSDRLGERASAAMARAEHVASAVGESGRRALEAPPAMKHHLKTATRELARDAADVGLGFAVAGVFAFFALAFLSVVVAVGLNSALGGQMGTFLVGLFYLIVAGVLALLGTRAMRDAKDDARRGVDNVKAEARAVTQPLRGLRT